MNNDEFEASNAANGKRTHLQLGMERRIHGNEEL